MRKITLVPHQLKYAKSMSDLSSQPQVKDSLGLSDEQTSLEGTKNFIAFIAGQERLGKQYSRCILNEDENLIGVITLKEIEKIKNTCHIGTWIGHPYWGLGYNQLAKKEILRIAFNELNLTNVFAGAKVANRRSQKAQEKLPYIRINVESEFPEEHRKLEAQVHSQCILNVIERDRFLRWYERTI